MKLIASILLVIGLSLPTLSCHAEGKIDKASNEEYPTLPIYVEASKTSKIAENVKITTPLVKIIQEKDWIKVGNRTNGTVGWISEEDYKKALETFYQPKTQNLFLKIKEKTPSDTIEIMAYKNGKKLDEKEAQALYHQLKKEQEIRDMAMGQWLRSMNQLFNRMHDEAFSAPFLLDHAPVIQPVVLIEKASQKEEKKDQEKSSN